MSMQEYKLEIIPEYVPVAPLLLIFIASSHPIHCPKSDIFGIVFDFILCDLIDQHTNLISHLCLFSINTVDLI